MLSDVLESVQEDEPHLSELYCSGKLRYIRQIGRGGMSTISLYALDKDGVQSEVAVKTLFRKFMTQRELMYLRTEATILTSICHDNIIRTYGITEFDSTYGLVLDYFPNGSYTDFFGYFRDVTSNVEEVEKEIARLKIRILGEVINAMEFLHRPLAFLGSPKAKSILHLDLKGENVLLDQHLHAKICDFGLSMMATLTKLRTRTTVHKPVGAGGTPGFIAPERLKYSCFKPNTKCDVYSFGILEYTILTDKPPYPEYIVNDFKLLAHHVVEKKFRPDVSIIPSIYPKDLVELMKECWSPSPIVRPRFQDLKGRMTLIKEEIGNFKNKAVHSVNIVLTYITHARKSEQTRQDAVYSGATLPDLITASGLHDSTTNSPYITNRMSTNMDNEPSTDGPDTISDPSDSLQTVHRSTTAVKQPVSRGPIVDSRPPSDSPFVSSDDDDDDSLLVPGITPGVFEIPFCSLTKILLSVSVAVIFAAAVIIAVVIPLIHKQSDSQGACPAVRKPNNGEVICENETKDTSAKCYFSCDDGYAIFGAGTTVCNGGKWTSKEPSCEKACTVPHITNGDVKCTNQTFVRSTCSVMCKSHHVIKGKADITCLVNGNWSAPVPSCVCPTCTVGDSCEYSISWKSVEHNLEAMQPYGTIPVNYGGKIFVCSTELHSITIKWSGICVDKGTGTKIKCANDHVSPPGAADAAAASLIRNLVTRKIFLEPCDANRMPTEC